MSFDAASFAIGRQSGGGGVTVEPLSVTENGTHAEEGVAYNPVTVNVPNSYTSADEGKAVRNGALAAQTAATKTGVGTYNTTYNNSVTFQLGALTNGAAAADIASGKTAYGADGSVITGTASVEPLYVTANGFFPLEAGKAYAPVGVDVPNTYTAADENKIVRNGQLMEQRTTTKTGVGTYDTTYFKQVKFQLGALATPAAAADIASGKTAYGADGNVITGTASGGGNPNYVETVTGTLANPWGSVTPATLQTAISGNNATALLTVDASAIGMGTAYLVATPFAQQAIAFQAVGSSGSSVADWAAVDVAYGTNGSLAYAWINRSGAALDATAYAQSITTTLTIIHHPLPSGS